MSTIAANVRATPRRLLACGTGPTTWIVLAVLCVGSLHGQESATHPAAEARQARGVLSPEMREKIEKRVDVNFVDTPLGDVVQFLSDLVGAQIVLQRSALSDVGVEVDTPVTLNLTNVRLRTALDFLLRDSGLDLDYTVRDDVLVITTVEETERWPITAVYDVSRLIGGPRAPHGPLPGSPGSLGYDGGEMMTVDPNDQFGFGLAGVVPGSGMSMPSSPTMGRAHQLIDVLTRSVVPESWEEVGGVGSIREFQGKLVVRQSLRGHLELESLLQQLAPPGDR